MAKQAAEQIAQKAQTMGPQARSLFDQLSRMPTSAFDAGKDNAVLYSGNAAHFMKRDFTTYVEHQRGLGFKNLEQTEAGRWLKEASVNVRDPLTQKDKAVLWDFASLRYADNAQGKCNALVLDSRPDRVYQRVELPRLLANDKITHVNGIPKDELLKTFTLSGKDGVVDTVAHATQQRCLAVEPEVRQWAKDQRTQDPAIQRSVDERLQERLVNRTLEAQRANDPTRSRDAT